MTDSNAKVAGERIKNARLQAGLTMEQFIERIDGKSGKGRSGTVNNWENGKNLPNKRRLKAIADLGGVSIDYLQGKTNEPTDISDQLIELNRHIEEIISNPNELSSDSWFIFDSFLEVLSRIHKLPEAESQLFSLISDLVALTASKKQAEKVDQNKMMEEFKALLKIINNAWNKPKN